VQGAFATAQQAADFGAKALHNSYLLGYPLFAMARVLLAQGHPEQAEPLLRQALALRAAVHPADYPRVLEVEVALANSLAAQNRPDEAATLSAVIEPLLNSVATAYRADLRQRLHKAGDARR